MAGIGFMAGVVFGLFVAWGWIGMLFAAVGVAVLLIGSLAPTMFRALFGLAIMGFLVAFLIAGGLTLI